MDNTGDLLVFVLVLALRLLVPLSIPRFPLPGIIVALILDAADQTIFQQFTSLNLDSYQSYDKALDIYYLTIAYLATMRNWNNLTAFEVSRFLLYYRLIGVIVFEFTHIRAMLLIFPNTFEYFFIFYEVVRLRWNPRRMSRKVVYGAAAAIWIVIKLPQEYWIHVAQRDVTDTLRANPALIPLLGVAIVALLVGAWWVITRRCPPADWKPSLADPLTQDGGEMQYEKHALRLFAGRGFDRALIEKIVLVSLISIIFAQILPDVSASSLEITFGVALVIIGNLVVSEWLRRRGVHWTTLIREFVAMAAINIGLAVGFYYLLPLGDGSVHLGNTLFFLMLLTLLVLLYDTFRPYYRARLAASNLPTE